MVYIIQCLDCGVSLNKEELEAYRQEFAKQIRQGVLLLPVTFKLVEVVKTDSIIDVEIIKDQTKVAEKVYFDDEPEYAPKIAHCIDCAHLKELTPHGRKVPDCGWCEKRDRSVSYNAAPIPCVYFKDKVFETEEEE